MNKQNVCLCGCFQSVKDMFIHGHNNSNLGKSPSIQTRNKLSLANKGKHHTEETKEKMSAAHKGKHFTAETRKKISVNTTKAWANPLIRKRMINGRLLPVGSTCKIGRGYRQVKTKDGWRAEHRVVMEKKLGRKLSSDEIPHHKNDNKADNRPSNLRRMTDSKHRSMHAKTNHLGAKQ